MDKNQQKGAAGEKAVYTLASDTYLKYWCYPGPRDERGNKNEICDLLILFQSTAIIIEVKDYSFDGDYEKYFRNTLNKAVSQVQGAERRLFFNPTPLYIKHPEKGEELFISSLYNTIFRIVINLNDTPLFYEAGRLTPKHNYAHIFNWSAFLQLVEELNTIPDFIHYLRVREDAFKQRDTLLLIGEEQDWDMITVQAFLNLTQPNNPMEKTMIRISGNELDLLANYYLNNQKFDKNLYSRDYNYASFQLDGSWTEFLQRKEVQRKKNADTASYFIDEFVKRELLHTNNSFNLEVATELLSLSRFERRILGQSFLDFCKLYHDSPKGAVPRRYGKMHDLTIGYVLYDESLPGIMQDIMVEVAAKGFLYWEKYQSKKIIVIGVTKKLRGFRCVFIKEVKPFHPVEEKQVIQDLKEFGWFDNMAETVTNIKEYPSE